jgi:hypothetical protein
LSIDLTTWAKESATVGAGTSFSTLVAKVATTARDVGKPVYTELGQTCLLYGSSQMMGILLFEMRPFQKKFHVLLAKYGWESWESK